MQGIGEHCGQAISLHGDEVGLWLDEGRQVDTAALVEMLSTPRAQAWSGVLVRAGEPLSDQDLWLATTLPDFCLIAASQYAVDCGLVAPGWPMGTPAILDGGSLAYRATRQSVNSDETASEFGAYAHGPDAARLAEGLAEQIRIWDRNHRDGPGPCLTVHPADTPDADLPDGVVLDKRHTRIVISWPKPVQ
ncbi:MAG: methyltransferase, FxLD system, partial [Pseudonocardiaceae bacterium]